MTDGKECAAHKHRDEHPIDIHHVWPLGDGGPNEPWNKVPLCPTAHREVHEYLRLLKKGNGKVMWIRRRMYGRMVRYLAESGYMWIKNSGVK